MRILIIPGNQNIILKFLYFVIWIWSETKKKDFKLNKLVIFLAG